MSVLRRRAVGLALACLLAVGIGGLATIGSGPTTDAAMPRVPDRAPTAPAEGGPSGGAAPAEGPEAEGAFAAWIGETLAEAGRRCAGGGMAHSCEGGVCVIRWRSLGGMEYVARALVTNPLQLLEGPALALGYDVERLPCMGAHRRIVGSPEHVDLVEVPGRGEACLVVADPSGPPLSALGDDVRSAAAARCGALWIEGGSR